MTRLIQIAGNKYGKLLVVARSGTNNLGQVTWLCKCDCGNKTIATGHHLRYGETASCGCSCAIVQTHGKRNTREYRSWMMMKNRCQNYGTPGWENYGGRGITVCEEWQSFEPFYESMGECPPDHSLDRIDVNGNYEPGNCRWADKYTQASNKRTNIKILHCGEVKTLKAACRDAGLNYKIVHQRMRKKGTSGQESFDWYIDREIKRLTE